MDMMRCRWCGKRFQSYGTMVCPTCLQELDEKYNPVRDYLYDNPNASIEEVVEETGVSERIILYYLKEGRLTMANASGVLRCEQCGAAISTGRMCERCQNKLNDRIAKPLQARMAAQAKAREEALRQQELDKRKMHTAKDLT